MSWKRIFDMRDCKIQLDMGYHATDALFADSFVFRYDINGTAFAYYKRITPLPKEMPIYQLMLDAWSLEPGNTFNTDFLLYSSEEDLMLGRHHWKVCTGGQPGQGFPGGCGKSNATEGKWASKRCGGEQSFTFYVKVLAGDMCLPFTTKVEMPL